MVVKGRRDRRDGRARWTGTVHGYKDANREKDGLK